MAANKEEKTVPLRGVWIFGLPLAAALIVGYVFIRSQNRQLEMKVASLERKNAVLEGEVYRYKSLSQQRDLEINYFTSPKFERYLAYSSDENFAWIFFRPSDMTWFVYADQIGTESNSSTFTLFIDRKRVGTFNKIADTKGLQKIGSAPLGDTATISIGEVNEIQGVIPAFQVPL